MIEYKHLQWHQDYFVILALIQIKEVFSPTTRQNALCRYINASVGLPRKALNYHFYS